jgi:polysaccharide deacetylase
MYRSVILPVVLLALACKAKSGEAYSSDTAGASTGPVSTTDSARDRFVSVAEASPAASSAQNPTRTPNELGRIMVLEYHLIGDRNSTYSRERATFRKDLELLYRRGYRPVSMAQVLDRKLDIGRGLSPVVFTFDDASPEQFSYVEKNGKLEIDPNSGLGIWLAFSKTHPDWENKAVFCLLSGAESGHNFFGDKNIRGQKTAWRFPKVKWLADNGFELCNHTVWHAQLNKHPDSVVQEQIARLAMSVDSAVPGYKMRSMALPQGLWPKNRALASKGSWKNPRDGKTVNYDYEAVFEVTGGPSRSPHDSAFNPLRTPRIQAIKSAIERTIDRLEKSGNAYISDGNPATVARPAVAAPAVSTTPSVEKR